MCHVRKLYIVHYTNQDMLTCCMSLVVHSHKRERPRQHVGLGLRLLTYGLATPLMTGIVIAVVQVSYCVHVLACV